MDHITLLKTMMARYDNAYDNACFSIKVGQQAVNTETKKSSLAAADYWTDEMKRINRAIIEIIICLISEGIDTDGIINRIRNN